jgi:hypothetical protein
MKDTTEANQQGNAGDVAEAFRSAVKKISLPPWVSSTSGEAARLAAIAIQIEQAVLQSHLRSYVLSEALPILHQHQVFKGFVQDTLTQLKRIRIRARGSEN